jgi:DNA polymerase-3 subunit epsilon
LLAALFTTNMDKQTIFRALSDLNFTAIDFEIANEQLNSLCSIGIVKVNKGKIDDEVNYIVRPKELRVTVINQQIHKLSEADLANQPELTSIWDRIINYFDERLLIAHNAAFDIEVLRQTLKTYNLKYPNFKYLCSQKLAQQTFTDLSNYRLSDVAKYLGLSLNHHNALSDAKVSAEIAIRSIPKLRQSELNFNVDELTANIKKIASEDKIDVWSNLFGDKKIDSDLLKPNLNVENKENFFFNKKVVFTGDLDSIDRKDAAKKIQKMGADINVSISKKTDIVIIGQGAGPSKMKKIQELKNKGFNIRLIYEDEFIELIK